MDFTGSWFDQLDSKPAPQVVIPKLTRCANPDCQLVMLAALVTIINNQGYCVTCAGQRRK